MFGGITQIQIWRLKAVFIRLLNQELEYWIFDSRDSTYISQDTVLFSDIWAIGIKVRVGNGAGMSVYWIATISLFVDLKDGRVENVMLKDTLNVPG
jgi:hypothetical protein